MPMPNEVAYEWDWEVWDSYGDVEEHNFSEKIERKPEDIEAGLLHLVLVRNEGCDAEGVLDRAWAYVDDGVLPDEFDNGITVPKYIRKQFDKFMKTG